MSRDEHMEKRINTILWGLVMAGILWIVRTQVDTGERVAVLSTQVHGLSSDVQEIKGDMREMRRGQSGE